MNIAKKTLLILLAILTISTFGSLSAAPTSWSVPVNLSSPSTILGISPDVAEDPSGNAVAIWTRFDGSNTIIQAATKPFGGNWGSPINLSAAGHDAINPKVVVDLAGNAVAVWEINLSGLEVIQAATLPFRGSWTSPINISGPHNAFNPEVATDSMGNAIAVWRESTVGFSHIIKGAQLPFGGNWTSAVSISGGPDASVPQLAIDSKGNAIAIWQNLVGSGSIIQAATLPFGNNSWSTPVDVTQFEHLHFDDSPQIAIAPSGNAIAIWNLISSGNSLIQTAKLPFGGSWTSPLTISATPADSPQIVIDLQGNATAVWEFFNGTQYIVQASSLPLGASNWSSPVDISLAGGSLSQSFPQLAVDALGNIVSVWESSNGINSFIQAATLPFGRDWTTPMDISTGAYDSHSPKVAIDPEGEAIAVWLGDFSNQEVVQAAEGTNLFPALPPKDFKGKVIKSRFLSQLEIIHRLSWKPSPSSNVIQYQIFRNGTLLGTIPGNGPFRFEDHNQKKKKRVTYLLYAVGAGGISTPATLSLGGVKQ